MHDQDTTRPGGRSYGDTYPMFFALLDTQPQDSYVREVFGWRFAELQRRAITSGPPTTPLTLPVMAAKIRAGGGRS